MEAWTDLYTEIGTTINTKLDEIRWIDLWHDQVSYLTDELPFPVPAVFISFNTISCNDKGLLIQDCDTQVDLYLYYETFSDTYQGSFNQDSAIEFMRSVTKLHQAFHGTSGVNFSSMRRVDMRREESGGAGNLYRISFACIVEDASAKVLYDNQMVNEVVIERTDTETDSIIDDNQLYFIP